MIKRTILTAACSILGLVSASGSATAETIGRLECSVVGVTSQEPIGDREGHRLTNVQFACFGADGPLKGAVYTGSSTQEWDGPQSTFLAAGGIYRVPGGLAVSQAIEEYIVCRHKGWQADWQRELGEKHASSLHPARSPRSRGRPCALKPSQPALGDPALNHYVPTARQIPSAPASNSAHSALTASSGSQSVSSEGCKLSSWDGKQSCMEVWLPLDAFALPRD